MKKVIDKILRVLGLRRITLRLDHRFVLLGALSSGATDVYSKALAIDLRKKFDFTTKEIRKAGIDVSRKKNSSKMQLQITRQQIIRNFWITEDQRKGIVDSLRRLPVQTMSQWVYTELAFQLATQPELFEIFNRPETPEKKVKTNVNRNSNANNRKRTSRRKPDPKPAG